MKKKNKKLILPIFIVLVVVVILGFVFFNTSQTGFFQYTGFGTNYHQELFQTTTQASTVTINSGANVYTFKAITYDGGNAVPWSKPSNYVSSSTSGCFQDIVVQKDGMTIDTIQSGSLGLYGDNGQVTYRAGSIPDIKTYTDDKGNTIDVKMVSSYFNGAIPKCEGWINSYDLKLSKNDFVIDVPKLSSSYTKGSEIPITFNVNNNLNQNVKATLTIDIITPSVVGETTTTKTQDFILQPGTNTLTYTIPVYNNIGVVKIVPSIDILYSGSNFQNLNYQAYVNQGQTAYSTLSQDYVPMLTYNLDSFQVTYKDKTITTIPIENPNIPNETVTEIPPVTQPSNEASGTGTTGQVIQPVIQSANNNYLWVVLSIIAVVIVLLVIVIRNVMRRKRR